MCLGSRSEISVKRRGFVTNAERYAFIVLSLKTKTALELRTLLADVSSNIFIRIWSKNLVERLCSKVAKYLCCPDRLLKVLLLVG